MQRRDTGARGIVVLAALASLLAMPASAAALTVSTDPPLYPDFDPSVSDYVTRCASDTPVRVAVSAPPDTTVNVDRQGARTGDFSTSVGLQAEESFRFVTTSAGAENPYFVRCLPSDFPRWTFHRSGVPQAEWYLVSPVSRTDFSPVPPGVSNLYGIVFDTNGVPVWWYKAGQSTLDFKLLPDGNVVWAHSDGTAEERRLDGSLVRTLRANRAVLDPHELLQLSNGDYVVSAQRTLDARTVCGHAKLNVSDNGIEEIGPEGSLVWSWWASDHIPLSEVPEAWCDTVLASPNRGIYDPFHINSIEPDGDGYVMSYRHLDAVYRIDRSSGDVTWKLGGVTRPESLAVVGDPLAGDVFRGQHDARILPDGSLTVHDNGYHPTDVRPPRAVRYAIDAGAGTATLIEQLDDPDPIATPLCCGSARRLPGGDWVMNWGSAGLMTELNPQGSRVLGLTFDDGLFSYRAQPVLPGVVSRGELRNGMTQQFPRGYARPEGAARIRVPLVPAFDECAAPDSTHGEPLAFGACRPPPASSTLTVGPASLGSVTYDVVADEADVNVSAAVSDVRWKGDLGDYTGELQIRADARITDRSSGATQDEAATVQDTQFPLAVPCTATAEPSVGATCSVSSTFNALVPGAVVAGRRANWELGPVEIYDGGAGGVAGAADARLFERQGLFVP